jgi:hypothetical protein
MSKRQRLPNLRWIYIKFWTSKGCPMSSENVTDLLEKFVHLSDKKRLGVLHGTKHRIDTKGTPVFQLPYRAGPSARQIKKKEVDRMLKLGVIEPSVERLTLKLASE